MRREGDDRARFGLGFDVGCNERLLRHEGVISGNAVDVDVEEARGEMYPRFNERTFRGLESIVDGTLVARSEVEMMMSVFAILMQWDNESPEFVFSLVSSLHEGTYS